MKMWDHSVPHVMPGSIFLHFFVVIKIHLFVSRLFFSSWSCCWKTSSALSIHMASPHTAPLRWYCSRRLKSFLSLSDKFFLDLFKFFLDLLYSSCIRFWYFILVISSISLSVSPCFVKFCLFHKVWIAEMKDMYHFLWSKRFPSILHQCSWTLAHLYETKPLANAFSQMFSET